MKSWRRIFVAALALAAILGGTASAQDQRPTITIGMPGIPPVFVSVQAYVAQQQKLFEKYGVNVVLRPFDSGAAAARAVASGNIDLSMSPSALIATMISNNPSVDLVVIYGYEKPDWLLGTLDPSIKRCEDVKGKPVGVDSLGGARSIALNIMLRKCNLKADDTQQVPLSANIGAAMISGQLAIGVLHIDDVPIIEREANKKVGILIDINDVAKVNHYLSLVASQKATTEKRDALVRVLAALIEAERFMRDPKNIDVVAKAAAPTGRSDADAKWSIREYVKMEFWPHNHGLDQKKLEEVIAIQKRVGNIKGDAVTYGRLVDLKLYDEALKLVK